MRWSLTLFSTVVALKWVLIGFTFAIPITFCAAQVENPENIGDAPSYAKRLGNWDTQVLIARAPMGSWGEGASGKTDFEHSQEKHRSHQFIRSCRRRRHYISR